MPTPFQLLSAMDRRCRAVAAPLPAQSVREDVWTGLGFRIGHGHFVAPMGEVHEVLPEPAYTRLPGVKSWVRGIANIRGRLLPTADLAGYLGFESSALRPLRRILIVEQADVYMGLVVDEVFGLQHFPVASHSEQQADVKPELHAALRGGFRREHMWWVLSPCRLLQDSAFQAIVL